MGRDMVDRVARRLHQLDGRPIPRRPPTDRVPLPGGEAADLDVLVEAARAREVPEPTARHLVQAYGSEAAAVLNLVERDRALGKPIVPGRPEIWAEVTHAVEREMALRLADVLMRRLHLFSETRDQAVPATSAVADHVGELLGWDAARRSEEIADYAKHVAQSRAYLKEVARVSRALGPPPAAPPARAAGSNRAPGDGPRR